MFANVKHWVRSGNMIHKGLVFRTQHDLLHLHQSNVSQSVEIAVSGYTLLGVFHTQVMGRVKEFQTMCTKYS